MFKAEAVVTAMGGVGVVVVEVEEDLGVVFK